MRFLKWSFSVAVLVSCGLLFLASTFRPHPAVVRASLLQNHRAADAPKFTPQTHIHYQSGTSLSQTGVRLLFPHIGDGLLVGTDRFLQSSLILVNTTRRATVGYVNFYADSGIPLEVTIDGVEASSFDFSLNGTEVKRLTTSGLGELVTGWAEVYSEQPLGGTVTFGIRDEEGTVYADVGVGPAASGRQYTFFADSLGWANTGVALSNPSSTETIRINLNLRDLDGILVTVGSIDLPPMGHRAQFLTELFSGVAGIKDFEGSVVLESENEFAGITLRTRGELLTSMPMVAPIPEGAEWTKLSFPHVGDGRSPGLRISTSVILFNNTEEMISGHVDFYRSDATGMGLKIGDDSGNTFGFSLEPGAVARLATVPGQELQTGWAEVVASGPLMGTALYAISDEAGRLLSEVGVEAAYLYQAFDLIADTLGAFNTGVAFANPNPIEAIDIRLELHDKWGYFVRGVTRTLPAYSHEALFLTELFPMEETIGEFEGILRVGVYVAGGYDRSWVAPVSLRQAGTKTTSLPTLERQYGFAPTTDLEFAQQLAGTAPAIYWNFSQRSGEFAVKRIHFSSSELNLNSEGLEAGLRFTEGYVTSGQGDQILEFVSDNDEKTRFSVYSFNREARGSYAVGQFEALPGGGVSLELEFLEPTPYSVITTDAYVGFTLPHGIFEGPSGVQSVVGITEITSVSISPTQDRPLVRRLEESFYFSAPSEQYPNMTAIEPLFMKRGDPCVVRGSNFGDSPRLYIRTFGGTRESIEPHLSSDTELEVVLPVQLRDDDIQVQNADGVRSNRYKPRFGFSPRPAAELLQEDSGEYELRWNINQSDRYPQPRVSRFRFHLFDADCDFSDLSSGEEVGYVDRELGSGESGGYKGYRLIVTESGDDTVSMKLAPAYDPENTFGTLTVTRVDEEGVGQELLLEFNPDSEHDPLDIGYYLAWDWYLTGLDLSFADPTGLQKGIVEMLSFPEEEGGHHAEQYVVFVAAAPQ